MVDHRDEKEALRVGDLVVCIDPHIDGSLKKGHAYSIGRVRSVPPSAAGEVFIKELPDHGSYFQKRFRKIHI